MQSQRLKLITVSLTIAVGLAIYLVVILLGEPKVKKQSYELVHKTGLSLVERIDTRLAKVEGITASVAHLTEALPKDEQLYKQTIAPIIDNKGDKEIVGGGVWPEPNAFADGVQKYSFFWGRNDAGKLDFSDGYNADDASAYQNEAWYKSVAGKTQNACTWSEGYVDPVTNTKMVTCSIPYSVNSSFSGVTTTDYSLAGMEEFLKAQNKLDGSDAQSYIILLDNLGNVLFEPHQDKSSSDMVSIDKLVQKYPFLSELKSALGTNTSFVAKNDTIINADSLVTTFAMPNTDWTIAIFTDLSSVTAITSSLTRAILLTILPILILVMGFLYFEINSILKQILETKSNVEALKNGSAQTLAVKKKDEIGLLRTCVNDYSKHLQGTLDTIKNEAKSLESFAHDLGQISQSIDTSSQAQLNSGHTMQTSAASMLQTADEISQKTNQTGLVISESLSAVNQARQKMKENITAVDDLCAQMNASTNTIAKLENDSKQVAEVLEVISGISEQTALLSLNAAIEAARAGEHGRGFAVVADEVRKLSERSQKSVNEIALILNSLQDSSKDAVQAMQTAAQSGEKASLEAQGTQESLSIVFDGFNTITTATKTIDAQTKDQNALAKSITDLNAKAQELNEQSATKAKELTDISTQIQQVSKNLARI